MVAHADNLQVGLGAGCFMVDNYHESVYRPALCWSVGYSHRSMVVRFEFDGVIKDGVTVACVAQGDMLRAGRHHLYAGLGLSVDTEYMNDWWYMSGRGLFTYCFDINKEVMAGVDMGADFRLAPHTVAVQLPYISVFSRAFVRFNVF